MITEANYMNGESLVTSYEERLFMGSLQEKTEWLS